MIPRRAAAILVMALATGAPGAAGPPQGGRGFFAGAVVDAATGRAIANAVVRASSGDVTQTRLTDELGRFYFKFLPEGDFDITAEKAGYIDGAYGKRRAAGSSITLPVSSGVVSEFVRIPLFRPAVISGIVADESGEPLPGVPVRAARREFVDGEWRVTHIEPVTTDDEGAFRLFDLVPGEYLVVVPSIQVTLTMGALDVIGELGSVPTDFGIVLSRNSMTNLPDFDSLSPNLLVPGFIPMPPDQDGRPAAYRTQYYPGGDRLETAVPIILRPSEHRAGIFFQMLPYPTTNVSGIVVGPDGPASAQVLRLLFLDDQDNGVGSEIAVTLSGRDGTFTFMNVPEGRYRLEARGRPTGHVPMLVPGSDGPFLWGSMPLAVGTTPIDDLFVDVEPAPAVSGRLVFETSGKAPAGRVVAGVVVTLSPANSTRVPYVTRSDQSGRFSILGVLPGDYTVRTRLPVEWSQKSVAASGLDATSGVLTVEPGHEVGDLTIVATDKPSRVIGVVRDARTFAVPGATVIAQPVGRMATAVPDARRARVVRASAVGVYIIDGLPPGEYVLTAIDDAGFDGWHETRRLEALRSAGVRVTVKDGEVRANDLRIR